MKLYQTFTFAVLLLLINWPAYGDGSTIRSRDLWLSATDFSLGTGENIRVTAAGLTLASGQFSGQYSSPVITAAIPFNLLVPQWESDLPAGSSLSIWLRTANRQGVWSDWYELHESHDMTLPEDIVIIGDFIAVPAVDKTHTQFQYSVSFQQLSDEPPLLRQMGFTFIDATAGPSLDELIAQQEALNQSLPAPSSADAFPKPFVLSRAVWCIHEACNYTEGLEYVPVTHLVVHHTVSSNSTTDWLANVRAIWHFHTFTRGWGDIGYNYLVDPNGVLYEGHLGGDNVVGTHAGGGNRGTMGLALLGTFTSVNPPPAMMNAAANILAWKADRRGIDVYSASRLPAVSGNVGWGLPHLMGHRDVQGVSYTSCPGDAAHGLLPWLRDEVATRLNFVSPYVYIDELSSAFTKSAANWYTPPGGCGFKGHAYYTWSTTDPGQSANWGEWRLNLPVSGRYEISVYAPYCITGRAETRGARYNIHHAGGSTVRIVSHDANVGTWMVLGNFDFVAGQDNRIYLSDLTTTDSGLGVWFDAIRWRPSVDIPAMTVTNTAPPHLSIHSTRTINFAWQRANSVAVSAVQLQASTSPDFSTLLLAADLSADANSHTHTFSQDFAELYWRIKMTTYLHGVVYSAPTRLTIDTVPPVSAVHGIYELPHNRFVIAWSGDGTGTAIASYNIDYRADNSGTWVRWLTNTQWSGALFIPPTGNGHNPVYWFRSQAFDAAGNQEPVHPGSGDGHTGEAIFLDYSIILPIIGR